MDTMHTDFDCSLDEAVTNIFHEHCIWGDICDCKDCCRCDSFYDVINDMDDDCEDMICEEVLFESRYEILY